MVGWPILEASGTEWGVVQRKGRLTFPENFSELKENDIMALSFEETV